MSERLPGWFPYLDVACAAVATGLWLVRPGLGLWPLLIGLAPWVARWLLAGRPGIRTSFDLPIVLFLATAGVSVWSAFDKEAAWSKFWLIIGAVFLYYAFANWIVGWGRVAAGQGLWALTVLGAAAGLYFLATHDWEAYPAKIEMLTSLGRALQAPFNWLVSALPVDRLHPNVMAGILAVLAPFAGGATWLAWREGVRLKLVAGLVASGLILLALLLTTTRGSWLALGAAALMVVWWQVARRLAGHHRNRRRWWFFGAPIAIILIGLLLLGMWPAAAGRLFAALPAPESGLTRADLYANSLSLVSDYPFVGGGLGSYMMLYSTYALLIHVGFSGHSHNLYLDLIIEQGVFAVLALMWVWLLMGEAVWRSMSVRRIRRRQRPSEEREITENQITDEKNNDRGRRIAVRQTALWSASLALVVLVLHGLIDDALYSSRGIVIIFLPLAFAMPTLQKVPAANRKQQLLALIVIGGVLLLLGLFSWRPLLANLRSNLAAVEQSRAELSIYTWPAYPLQDAVRRELDMSTVEAGYRRALAWNPANSSANRRLGQIYLSLGRYEEALALLSEAYRASPWDVPTRRLLAEALAVNGRPEDGATLWSSINNDLGQLDVRLFWYDHIGEDRLLGLLRSFQRSIPG